MKNLVVSIVTFALVTGSAAVASATTKDASVAIKPSAMSCATSAKPMKTAKTARVENRCASDSDQHGVGTVPLVFGGAIVAGVVAIAVTNSGNHNATSP